MSSRQEQEELEHQLEKLLPLVAEHGPSASEQRRPSREVIQAMGDGGLLRVIVPAAYGGWEAHPGFFLDLVEHDETERATLSWLS